jgi:hypothetical protein
MRRFFLSLSHSPKVADVVAAVISAMPLFDIFN